MSAKDTSPQGSESLSAREKALLIVEPGTRFRWAGLVLLAVGIAIVEAIGALLIFALLGLLSGEGSLSLPVLGDLSKRFPEASDEALLTSVLVVSGVFFLLRPIAIFGQVFLQRRTEQRTGVSISARLYRGYQEMPYEFHLQRNSAVLIRTCLMSVLIVVRNFLSPMTIMMSEGLVVAALLVVVSVTSPLGTALAVLLIGSAAFMALVVVLPRLRRLGEVNEEATEQVLKVLNQTFDGIRDIRIAGREAFFADAFWKERLRLARARYRVRAYSEVPKLLIETAIFGLVIALIAVTDIDQESGGLAVLGLFGYAALRIMPSINKIVAMLNRLKAGGASLDNVVNDLQLIERSRLTAPGMDSDDAVVVYEGQIEVAGVSFAYQGGGGPVLQEIDLVIPKGSSFGIVGPTGSGKTTLLDILLGLLDPTDGAVLVDGVDIAERRRSWRRHLGIVPQMVFLIDDTLRSNIALGIRPSDVDESAVVEAMESAQLDRFVGGLSLGLDTVVGERGVRISGGERQRIAIARALYTKPDILVFDEATSALDTVTEAALLDAIQQLSGDYTMITVAHRLASVMQSDQIALLLDGHISDVGTYSELERRSEVFRQMAR